MNPLPFYCVTLTHPDWSSALRYTHELGNDVLPELRLDLFPKENPSQLVRDLRGRCVVSCRRMSEGGQWPDDQEVERVRFLRIAYEAHPQWMDFEWDRPLPSWWDTAGPTSLLRSVHVPAGVMDLRDRFRDRPEGDAFKWVGVAQTLSDNASVKKILEKARAEAVVLSAFLLGPKGLPSRYLQRPWGGSFVYVAPPGQTPAVKSQPSLDQCRMMGCERMNEETVVAGLMGEPILHSKGFQFHADQFALEEKNIAYIPFETQDPKEARLAMESLEIQGLSITTPLKRTLSELLGLPTIANTVWKRTWGDIWRHANTDQLAFEDALTQLAQGPVVVLGDGAVATICCQSLKKMRRPFLQVSRRQPLSVKEMKLLAPVGVVQATSLGMKSRDPLPFPDHLAAMTGSLKWAMEWAYKETTLFEQWAKGIPVTLVDGQQLFQQQALLQHRMLLQMQYTKRVKITSFGTLLREARLASRLSLDDVAQQLHISMNLLEAMEEDQWHLLPTGRAKPLARQVGEFLHFRPEDHWDAFEVLPSFQDPKAVGEILPITLREKLIRLGALLLTTVVAVSLFFPGKFIGQKQKSTPPVLSPPPDPKASLVTPSPTNGDPLPVLGEYDAKPIQDLTVLQITALSTVQIDLIMDELAQPITLTLAPQQTVLRRFRSGFKLRSTQPQNFRFTVNGQNQILPSGAWPPASMWEVTYDRQGKRLPWR